MPADSFVRKLVDISSIPLSLEPALLPKKLLKRCAAQLADEYVGLLKQRNGFLAFEGALHALPAGKPAKGYDLQTWNDPGGWIAAYGETANDSLFFAEDLFGEQFALKGNAIYRFDPETARFTEVAPSLEGWAKVILEDYRTETGYELAHEWQTKHGALQPAHRLVPKIPFSLGGEYAIANLMALDARKGMELRADIWRQVKDLPPGTKVEIKLTE